MWGIAGLGNPGRKYARTRHNVGFMVIEEIAARLNIRLNDIQEDYRIGEGFLEGQHILLVEPLLYMNMSGLVIKQILADFSLQTKDLIIIHDDLDLEIGTIKIKRTGSSGGHKGIESILQSLSSKNFIRVKIGIGRQEGVSSEDYVLSKFKRIEVKQIKHAIQNATDAVYTIVSEGLEKAMNIFNRR